MSEMVERVARRICEKQNDEFNQWDDLGGDEQQEFQDIARAAIEAMRVPTVIMRKAGTHASSGGYGVSAGVDRAYKAMIDAALEEAQ